MMNHTMGVLRIRIVKIDLAFIGGQSKALHITYL